MSPDQVWIVVPAYNEARVVRSVVAALEREGYRIVVVDDGSADSTYSEVRRTGAHACRHVVNLGQGAALQTGIRYALEQGAEYIVTFDADGQHTVSDIPKLLAPLVAGDYEVAIGSRFLREGRAVGIPRSKKLLLKLATLYTRIALGIKVTDTHNGLRAFTAEAAGKLNLAANGMAHATEILKQISTKRLRFVEVPVIVHYTAYSVAKGQRISNALNIFWDSFAELLAK